MVLWSPNDAEHLPPRKILDGKPNQECQPLNLKSKDYLPKKGWSTDETVILVEYFKGLHE